MPESFIGNGSIKHIQSFLDCSSIKRIFLLTGKASFSLSGAEEKLRKYIINKEVCRFSEFDLNPKMEDVEKGVKILKSFLPDVVIAIGGGSVIDMGKLINIIAVQQYRSIETIITGEKLIVNKGLPFIAIPTTAGTGSEATHFAVAYISKKKYSLAHSYLLPDYHIVDPDFAQNLPSYTLASSGFDALSQATESFWSIRSTEQSKEFAIESINIILKSIKKAVNDRDSSAIESLCYAANLAGKAINITATTAPHAISYPITTYYGVAHGHAVALNVGKFFIINSSVEENSVVDKRGIDYIREMMVELIGLFGCENEYECCDKWYKIMKEVGLETSLFKLGIRAKSDVIKIVSNVNLERLRNNPVLIKEKMLYKLLQEGML